MDIANWFKGRTWWKTSPVNYVALSAFLIACLIPAVVIRAQTLSLDVTDDVSLNVVRLTWLFTFLGIGALGAMLRWFAHGAEPGSVWQAVDGMGKALAAAAAVGAILSVMLNEMLRTLL